MSRARGHRCGGVERIVEIELNQARRRVRQSCATVRELIEAAKKLLG